MKTKHPFITGIMIAVYVFVFLPILVVILMSFNASRYGTFPFEFSLEWYKLLFSGGDLGRATVLTIWFSLGVMLTTVTIGIMTSVGLKAIGFRFSKTYTALLNLGIIIPWLVLGISMLMIFNMIGLGRSYLGMFLGNVVVALPYVVLLVHPALISLNDSIERAARTLGASSLRAFFTIVLPSILPAVAAGSLMSFMVCFNNFIIQYYLAPFGERTLPLEIYNLVRVGYKPDINALASIMILVSVGFVLLIYKLGYGAKKSLF